ncbi:PadR family transcriptional regulator [Jiangella asiatica]|uniref:PadR family transcriptional regulator n=2 Tax=Jiangella asiatica TaxID=2530372 RepID=A0A4R5D7P9_9ACTN|nr:PadR family transcriptional regulator [Jiangella asiatica]
MNEERDRGRGHAHGRRHRPPFDPAAFGPGFGPGGFGPWERRSGGRGPRRGPRRRRGDVRTAVLVLLADGPKHGYQLIQEITERSDGLWKPSAGSIYPVLQLLEDEGMVRFEEHDGRRVVHLTETGTTFVSENRAELDRVWEPFDGEHTASFHDLRETFAQLGMAGMQVLRAGTPEQVEAARRILRTATRDLYALLAEGPPNPRDGDRS